jgi:hypothetical protein
MKVGDLVKEIYHGMVGIICEIGPHLIQVMFCDDGACRWLRRDSLEVV